MLPKFQRIARSAFKSLLESKKYAHSTYFSLKTAQHSRFQAAISVSKKVSKKATDRNRVRRRSYAALSSLKPQIDPGYYLFSAKPGAERLTVAEIAAEFASLIKKS